MESTAQELITLDLPSSTAVERQAHAEMLLNLEAKKIASTMDVPTLPHHVQDGLRNIGEPVRLFGEGHANIRERLRLCLAKLEVEKRQRQGEGGDVSMGGADAGVHADKTKKKKSGGTTSEVQYTHASEELIQAREYMASYSLERANERLRREKKRRWGGTRRSHDHASLDQNKRALASAKTKPIINILGEEEEYDEAVVLKELDDLDESCKNRYVKIKDMALEGSQYGDNRPLSAVAVGRQPGCNTPSSSGSGSGSANNQCLVATGGWTGSIKLWDGSSSALSLVSTRALAHEDRIMSVAMQKTNSASGLSGDVCHLASASIDLTGKLWKVGLNENGGADSNSNVEQNEKYNITEMAELKGHAARLCKVAFHPSGRYVGTTSFDHTWRLWDIESGGKEILLQDGHWKETYGIGFHPDGSLVSTTDFGSVVQVWDMRSGKSACHFLGHAKRVLCTEFSPNGFQLATAGDDGTIKVWDLRQRKLYASIPAHSRLITQIKFAHEGYGQNGEYLTSCSFDGTGKVWSTRNWKLLSTLRGHEGKIMGVDILDGTDTGIVTVGYDKTMKYWR